MPIHYEISRTFVIVKTTNNDNPQGTFVNFTLIKINPKKFMHGFQREAYESDKNLEIRLNLN